MARTLAPGRRRFGLPNENASKRINLIDHAPQHKFVTGRLRSDEVAQEDRYLCFQGKNSGSDNCGYSTGRDAFAATGGVIKRNFICINEPPEDDDGGDSGGPVYENQANESNVHAAGLITHHVGHIDGADMCFDPIGRVLGQLNVNLAVKGVN